MKNNREKIVLNIPGLWINVFIITLAAIVLPVRPSFACTIVTMADGERVLIGNNEDWGDTRTKMWFYPAADGEYGRVCFGFTRDFGTPQGGINEKGLFLDANGLPPTGWRPDPNKPLFEDGINDYILAHCATVEDAVAFFKKYSVYLGGGKFVIADASGASIVVEWANGADQMIRRTGFYQISTNFLQSSIIPGKVTDDRYNIAEQIILRKKGVSIDVMRSILAATHQEWLTPTIYSYICDLKNLRVYLYNFHNFEEVFEFDLAAELKKGKHSLDIPTLFSVKTFAASVHEKKATKLATYDLRRVIEEGGLESAIRWYQEIKDKHWKVYNYYFNEDFIREMGLDLLKENKSKEALDVFQFNASIYPDSADVWEQLADAYLNTGNRQLAIENYEKALQVNSRNTKVQEKLKQLLEK